MGACNAISATGVAFSLQRHFFPCPVDAYSPDLRVQCADECPLLLDTVCALPPLAAVLQESVRSPRKMNLVSARALTLNRGPTIF